MNSFSMMYTEMYLTPELVLFNF